MPRKPNITQKVYQQGATLEKLFGSITAKILDFLSTHNDDYSKQDIAKYSGVSPRHTTIAIEQLEQLQLITKTRNIGHAHMYKYNTQNKAAQLLEQFTTEIAIQTLEKQTKNKQKTTTTTAASKQLITA